MKELDEAREESVSFEPMVKIFTSGKATIGAYCEDSLRNQFENGVEWLAKRLIDRLNNGFNVNYSYLSEVLKKVNGN